MFLPLNTLQTPWKLINKWRSCISLKCWTLRQLCETEIDHAQRDKYKNSYFHCCVIMCKPISTELGMWVEGRLYHFFHRHLASDLLVLGLGPPVNSGRNDRCAFFGYKSMIYELNLTKFLMNVGTIAANKPCRFQKYWSRQSPLWGEKVTKI